MSDRTDGADGDNQGRRLTDGKPFRLPEFTSEPYKRDGKWYRFRHSACLGWEIEVPPPDDGAVPAEDGS